MPGALYGAIEAGGTKFICAVGSGPEDLSDIVRIPTTLPQETLGKAIDYFIQQKKRNSLGAIGVGTFGPVNLDPISLDYGTITSTPKPGWSNTNIFAVLKQSLDIPVAIETDVNAAAFGENQWGAAQGLEHFLYLTIGTGIGMGGLTNGTLIHGMLHPEAGHMFIPHDLTNDPFEGYCPYHKDCLEGLASGPALKKRWGKSPEHLPDGHLAWQIEAKYLALCLANLTLTFSPQRIILGGGVMQRSELFKLIRKDLILTLNGYVRSPLLIDQVDQYIVPPGLGNQSGILGALALARNLIGS